MDPQDPIDDAPDARLIAIIDRWRTPLVGILMAWRVPRPDEMAQDVLAEFWLSRERYRGSLDDPAQAGSWLRGIAWNLVRSDRRRAALGPRLSPEADALSEPSEEGGPERAAMGMERDAAVRKAVDELPDDQRAVVYMRLLEGTSGADVGAFLGISERAVEGRLRRARVVLARVLGPAPEPSNQPMAKERYGAGVER